MSESMSDPIPPTEPPLAVVLARIELLADSVGAVIARTPSPHELRAIQGSYDDLVSGLKNRGIEHRDPIVGALAQIDLLTANIAVAEKRAEDRAAERDQLSERLRDLRRDVDPLLSALSAWVGTARAWEAGDRDAQITGQATHALIAAFDAYVLGGGEQL